MNIQIRKHNGEVTDVLRAHVNRRLDFALGRFGEQIGQVRVRLSRTRGRLSGANRRCEIEVELDRQTVRAEDTDADALAAVSHAVAQLKRSVSRELARQHAWNRA
jgi:ribosomal subunit interface protein